MKKRKRFFLLITLALTAALLAGCTTGGVSSPGPSASASPDAGADAAQRVAYVTISQEEAKQIMDTQKDIVILDVRTKAEYDEGHIENAVQLPYDEIPQRAPAELTDKAQTILVYCRSGNRSRTASQSLSDLGYTNVKNFGGINTWAYGTVK